jgi:serine/threonine protein phosphatase 1
MIGKFITKANSEKRFAIADIHGCLETLKKLITQISLTTNDQLFLLGDYINRGPNSSGVMSYIMELQNLGFQVYPLRGNHEQILIESRGEKLSEPYYSFLKNLPYYYETEDYFFVHASIDFDSIEPLQDTEAMLWKRYSSPDIVFLNGRKIIHGHTIHTIDEIKEAIKYNFSIIPLDNGCYKGLRMKSEEYGEHGNLCALNLDTLELIIQKNIDEPRQKN